MDTDTTAMSVEEREARIDEIRTRQQEIHSEYEGQVLPDREREEFESLAEERVEHERAIAELKARAEYLGTRASNGDNREAGAGFHTRAAGVARGEDIYDLSTIDRTVGPDRQAEELRDRALRSVERMHPGRLDADREAAQARIERMLGTAHRPGTVQVPKHDKGALARYLLEVGSPVYERAWLKLVEAQIQNRPPILSVEESRAASVGTGSEGGFAVPYTLDPTIIPTGNWSVNPMRAIARVEQISGSNEWRGVSAGDMTATRRAEAAEVADNMVALAQPTAIVSRVDAFVPFSFEVDQDWSGFRSEIARLFAEAKDNEEASSFITGNGAAPNPQGVITGATNVVTTAGTAAFVVADLYGTKNALPPRFRPMAKWMGEQSTYDRIRQFDTQGGAQIFIENLQLPTSEDNVPAPGNIAARLFGKPAYEASGMDATLASGSEILVYGDFRYYLIVDRIGMSIEVVPHLFATANNRPSGQRGLLAFWRNTGKVLSAAAFRVTKTL